MNKISLIQNLINARNLGTNEECEIFENSLQALETNISIDDVEKLLKVFYDKTENDELMFALIHLIEKLSGKEYLIKIALFSPFMADAHEWAMTLNKRILNNQTFFEMYINAIDSLNSDNKEKILALLDDVKNDNPTRFSEKVELIKNRIKI